MGDVIPMNGFWREGFGLEKLERKEALKSRNMIFSRQENNQILNLLFCYFLFEDDDDIKGQELKLL